MKILYKKANGIKMFLTSIVLCFSLGVAMAQPALMWQKTYGGSDNDVVPIIWQTADSGYIMAGSSVSADQQVSGHHGPAGGYNNDIWVVKTDNSGTLQWENSFGGAGNEAAYYVQQTTDGGYIVVGVTDTANGDVTNWHTGHIGSLRTTDFWVVKLFPNGTIEWEKSFGGSKNDWATAAQQTADGGYIIAGFTNSTDGDATGGGYHSDPFQPNANDYWVVKISAGGAIQWQHCYGGKYEERPYSIHQTSQDRGYIVAGEAKGAADGDVGANYGNSDVWAIKIDSNGTLQWEKNYGGTGYDRANFVRHTAEGGYVITGITTSNDSDVVGWHPGSNPNLPPRDAWVIKLDNTGVIQWQKPMGGSNEDEGNRIRQTKDGGYIVGCSANSTDGDVSGNHSGSRDYWVVKLDGSGNILCDTSWGGTVYDDLTDIIQTNDGKYVAAGHSNSTNGDVTGIRGLSDYWIVKFDMCEDTTDSGDGDTTAACIKWNLLADSAVSSVSGNITGQPETIGPGSNTPLMSVLGYNANGQRLWCGITGWVQGALDSNRYAQFDATPASGNGFTVNSVSFDYSDFQNGIDLYTIAFKVGYSLDNWNTVNFIGQGSYLGTSVQTFTATPNVVVPAGQSFSLRIFPYALQNQQAGSPTQATHKNVIICGGTYPASGCNYYDTVHVTVYDTTHVTVYDTVITYVSVTDTLVIDVKTVGIPGFPSTTNTLLAYPNPAKDRLIIDNGNYPVMSGYSIKVTNSVGQVVFTQAINQQQFNIDLSAWGGAGTYFLSIIDPNQNIAESKTIVIQ